MTHVVLVYSLGDEMYKWPQTFQVVSRLCAVEADQKTPWYQAFSDWRCSEMAVLEGHSVPLKGSRATRNHALALATTISSTSLLATFEAALDMHKQGVRVCTRKLPTKATVGGLISPSATLSLPHRSPSTWETPRARTERGSDLINAWTD